MIDGNHGLSISRQAQLVGISRGSVYYVPKPAGAADLVLLRRIDERTWSIRSWARACCATSLVGAGFKVGRKHVGKLMECMGIEALYRKPGTNKKHPDGQRIRLPQRRIGLDQPQGTGDLAAKVAITLEASLAVDGCKRRSIATAGRRL